MCGKILTIIIVTIALLLAILANVLPPEQLDYVIVVSKFFDIMIPVLAVGALLKYLCCKSGKACCHKTDKDADHCPPNKTDDKAHGGCGHHPGS